MPTGVRMALAWAFYWEASHAAGAHDVPPRSIGSVYTAIIPSREQIMKLTTALRNTRAGDTSPGSNAPCR